MTDAPSNPAPPSLPATSADHVLRPAERDTFATDGYLVLPGALPAERVATLRGLAESEFARFRARPDTSEYAILNQHDLVGRDPEYLELVDWPTTFPKVFGVLGWNIQLFHTQLVVTPPTHPDAPRGGYAWHQDNNRMNRDFDPDVAHPRVSVKVAYFLSDVPESGMGNFCVVPGSHRATRTPDPDTAVEVTAQAGDALLFDRRLWHAASTNHSTVTRMVLFYGYSYRWLRPKSDMGDALLTAGTDPIRRQLLGAATGANGYFDPTDADVPLREWIRAHLGASAVAE